MRLLIRASSWAICFVTIVWPLNVGNAQPLGQWVDFDGDGYGDMCNVYGSQLICYLGGQGTSPTGRIVLGDSRMDFGYAQGRAWADVDGDGGLDYCRVIGEQKRQGFRCDTGDRKSINDGIIQTLYRDWGYPETRVWADADGDGKDDFCRDVGYRPNTYTVCSSVVANGSTLVFGGDYRVNRRPSHRAAARTEFALSCVAYYPNCEPATPPTPPTRPGTGGTGGGSSQRPAMAYVIARTEMQGHGCTSGSAQYFGNSGDRTIVINVHYSVAGFPQYNKDYDLEFAPHTEKYEGCNGPAYGGGNVSYRVNSARFK